MSKAIQVQIGENTLLVETDETIEVPSGKISIVTEKKVDDSSDSLIPKGGRKVSSLTDIKHSVADVKSVIISCCKSLHSAIEDIPQPERFAVEFGVKLAGETGVPLLTKASGEANFKITVEWKKG